MKLDLIFTHLDSGLGELSTLWEPGAMCSLETVAGSEALVFFVRESEMVRGQYTKFIL